MQESFEESHKQQLEELRINMQKEHETRHSDVVSQHQMEMKSLREFLDTEHREKFEVKFIVLQTMLQTVNVPASMCSYLLKKIATKKKKIFKFHISVLLGCLNCFCLIKCACRTV